MRANKNKGSVISSKSGKAFLVSLVFTLIICVFIAAILGVQIRTKNTLLKDYEKKTLAFVNYSAKELVKHELINKPENKRWILGWSVSANNYIYIDQDGTKYPISLSEVIKLKQEIK